MKRSKQSWSKANFVTTLGESVSSHHSHSFNHAAKYGLEEEEQTALRVGRVLTDSLLASGTRRPAECRIQNTEQKPAGQETQSNSQHSKFRP